MNVLEPPYIAANGAAYLQWKQYNSLLAQKAVQQLKKGIWVYFILLIFEGALRKWVLPGLATPLLIIRDPVALWLLVKAWQRGWLPVNLHLIGMALIGFLGICTAILVGHGDIPVALFGARILLIHFPLTFVIGRIFDRNDVIKLGRVTLWLLIPVTVLVALQFYSPQSAWVNRGVGGNMEGSGFSGALDYFRPSGTFSFTNGNSLLYSFGSCFIFYFWLNPKQINRLVLIGATVCLLAVIPLSISRSLLFSIIVVFLFTLIGTSQNSRYISKMLMAAFGMLVALAVLSQTAFFQTASEAFTVRFESATENEGGLKGVLGGRYLGGMITALIESPDIPYWGYGLGMGTNVGSMLLTGSTSFLIAEGEWGRVIGELGLLMGLGVIYIRLSFCMQLLRYCYLRMRLGELLPWILLSFSLLSIPQGQWAQPTSLGFSTLIGGLTLASLNNRGREETV